MLLNKNAAFNTVLVHLLTLGLLFDEGGDFASHALDSVVIPVLFLFVDGLLCSDLGDKLC